MRLSSQLAKDQPRRHRLSVISEEYKIDIIETMLKTRCVCVCRLKLRVTEEQIER